MIWLLLLLWLLSIAATVWITMHVTMWAGGRLEVEERGGDREEFPWNWRVIAGAGAYFGWLEAKARREGRIVDG